MGSPCPTRVGRSLQREHRCFPGSPWSSLRSCSSAPAFRSGRGVRSDQVAYADAIGDANKRLALSNIVKIRYGDTPTFLATSQVVAGYQLQAAATVGADLVNEGSWRLDAGTLGVVGSFSNNPTITYSPVSGADFSALLLAPISPADLFGLILGGVPPDLVLGLGLAQINGERNRLLLRPNSAASERRFAETVDLMVQLHEAGLLQLRIEGEGKGARPISSWRTAARAKSSRKVSPSCASCWR